MSLLVDRAIEAAGLSPLASARRGGDLARVRQLAPALETADLLLVGALADSLRAEEVGDVVRVFANVEADRATDVVAIEGAPGLPLLRRVAIARIVSPRGARVRVDWAEIGLDLAQVALGFGANELVGPLANRRGLPIAESSTLKVKGAGMVSVQALKKRELETLLAHAGRRAIFAPARSHLSSEAPHV